MNILVTGASGLIGCNLVRALKELGHSVTTVDLKQDADYSLNIAQDDLSVIKQDIDLIYHLAAQPFGKGSELNPIMDLEYNVMGTLKMCYFAKQKRVNKIVYASTMAVYGDNEFANEDSPLNPLSNYAVSKLCGEYYIKKFSKECNFEYTIFRLWNTYGPGQDITNEYKGVVSAFATQVLKSNHIKVTGSVERYRDVIYVDDVVEALLISLKDLKNEIYNVSTGKRITIRELIETIIKVRGKKLEDFIVEDIGGHIGDQQGCVGDNSRLVKKGWKPKTNLEEGLSKFLFYIEQKK